MYTPKISYETQEGVNYIRQSKNFLLESLVSLHTPIKHLPAFITQPTPIKRIYYAVYRHTNSFPSTSSKPNNISTCITSSSLTKSRDFLQKHRILVRRTAYMADYSAKSEAKAGASFEPPWWAKNLTTLRCTRESNTSSNRYLANTQTPCRRTPPKTLTPIILKTTQDLLYIVVKTSRPPWTHR